MSYSIRNYSENRQSYFFPYINKLRLLIWEEPKLIFVNIDQEGEEDNTIYYWQSFCDVWKGAFKSEAYHDY